MVHLSTTGEVIPPTDRTVAALQPHNSVSCDWRDAIINSDSRIDICAICKQRLEENWNGLR